MINAFAKLLVLVHAILSVAGMGVAMMLVFSSRDLGRTEPVLVIHEYHPDNKPKTVELQASDYDISRAVVVEAGKNRDRMYAVVKPEIDSIRANEQYQSTNHLFYQAEMRRLRESSDEIQVRRLLKLGVEFEIKGNDLSRPAIDANVVANLTKSYKAYQQELWNLMGHVDDKGKPLIVGEIDKVEVKIRELANETKKVTSELTGTDEANKVVHPGLYHLTDREFKYQEQIKKEIDEIKPEWSKAIEQARLFQFRRADLEATLTKLKGELPPPKNDKKLKD